MEYHAVGLPYFIPLRDAKMWSVSEDSEFIKKRDKWPKKYRRELKTMIAHANSVLVALNAGTKPEQCKTLRGVRSEPNGLLATDQTGLGKNALVSRLYLYPDAEECCLYFLTLGDKDSQSEDIKWCKEWVASHEAGKPPDKEDSTAKEEDNNNSAES